MSKSFPREKYELIEPAIEFQQTALYRLQQEYKTLLASPATSSPGWLRDAAWQSSTLRRILVACEWKSERATSMLSKALGWRKSFGTDALPFLPPPIDFCRGYTKSDLSKSKYERQYRDPHGEMEQILCAIRKNYIAAWHKWDRNGHPIYIERAGYTNPKSILQSVLPFSKSDKLEDNVQPLIRSHVLVMELGEHLCRVQSLKYRRPICQFTYICDMENYGWRHMYAPSFEVLRRAIEIDKNYYPESMHVTVVVNAPALMSAVWTIIKPMLTQRTRSKVHIYRKGEKQTQRLLELVEPEHLPTFLGGKCNCSGGCVPNYQ